MNLAKLMGYLVICCTVQAYALSSKDIQEEISRPATPISPTMTARTISPVLSDSSSDDSDNGVNYDFYIVDENGMRVPTPDIQQYLDNLPNDAERI